MTPRPLDPLPDETLDELERLEKESTSRGWTWSKTHPRDPGELPYVPQGATLGDTLIMLDDSYEGSEIDCALISAALAALPSLLAEVRAARAGRDATPDPFLRLIDACRDLAPNCPWDDATECVRCREFWEALTAAEKARDSGRDARATPGTTDDGRTP